MVGVAQVVVEDVVNEDKRRTRLARLELLDQAVEFVPQLGQQLPPVADELVLLLGDVRVVEGYMHHQLVLGEQLGLGD